MKTIFYIDPRITKKDRERLQHHLVSYNHLNELFVLNPDFPLDDLKRLVLLELEGNKRQAIFQKLVGRIMGHERRGILTRLEMAVMEGLEEKKPPVAMVFACSQGHQTRGEFDPETGRQVGATYGGKCSHVIDPNHQPRPLRCRRKLRPLKPC